MFFVLNTTFNLTETSKEPPKNDMFMFVNMLVIDRYTAIGNTSSTKSLPSIYWVFINFLWASPNVWKIHKHLKLAKVHLQNIQGVKLLELQRNFTFAVTSKVCEY